MSSTVEKSQILVDGVRGQKAVLCEVLGKEARLQWAMEAMGGKGLE